MTQTKENWTVILQSDKGHTLATIHRVEKNEMEMTVDIGKGRGPEKWYQFRRGPDTGGVNGTLYYRRAKQ